MQYGIFGFIILVANLYAIYQVLTSRASGLAKIVWTLIILALPVIGLLIWLFAGPRGGSLRV